VGSKVTVVCSLIITVLELATDSFYDVGGKYICTSGDAVASLQWRDFVWYLWHCLAFLCF